MPSLENTTSIPLVNETIIVTSFARCPKQSWELFGGSLSGIIVIICNIICMIFLRKHGIPKHPESNIFVLNLVVSNIFCGFALFLINILPYVLKYNRANSSSDFGLKLCNIVGAVFVFCISSPFVALATLGLDIACYCHLSIEYKRRMSRQKIYGTIASGWMYTLGVIAIVLSAQPEVLCNKYQWKLNILFIIFPVFLMLLPAAFIVILFTYVIRNYWKNNYKRHMKLMNAEGINGAVNSKACLMRKFMRRFFYLIIFSIICSFIYTLLTVLEVVIERETHIRICVLYRMDRFFISLNSLITPWIHCLATRDFRKKFFRKYFTRWRKNKMVLILLSTRRRSRACRIKSCPTITVNAISFTNRSTLKELQ